MKRALLTILVFISTVYIGACSDEKPASGGDAGAAAPVVVAGAENAAPAATVVSSLEIPVEGMVCDGCANAIEEKLSALEGVKSCTASYETTSAKVTFDPAKVDAKRLYAAITELGYKVKGQAAPKTPH